MSKNKILTIAMVLFLMGILLVLIKYATKGDGLLVNPWAGKIISQPATAPSSIPTQVTPSYNPPKQIQYDSTTDLKQELETINPEVLESDFE